MKKFISICLLIMAVAVFATWQYRLLAILSLVLLNKKKIRSLLSSKWKYAYKTLVGVLVLGIFIAIPNYFHHGRVQLHYLNEDGKAVSTPLFVYAVNVIFPEEEVMNMGMKAAALMPTGEVSRMLGFGSNRFIRDAQKDFWSGKGLQFYKPYNDLSWNGSNPGSFAEAQTINEMFGTNYDGIYITTPRHWSIDRKYPVVFYAHGYLGSWELQAGVTSKLDDCFVVQIGTRDLSGIYSFDDINRIFSKYIPYMKSLGYNIDENNLHFIGLSNGGTASNIALKEFSHMFKTITFVSTSCDVIKKSTAKVILIGGGKDASSSNLPSAERKLRKRGTETILLYDETENHYFFVHQEDKIIRLLNEEIND